jgi:hypothetical protein
MGHCADLAEISEARRLLWKLDADGIITLE